MYVVFLRSFCKHLLIPFHAPSLTRCLLLCLLAHMLTIFFDSTDNIEFNRNFCVWNFINSLFADNMSSSRCWKYHKDIECVHHFRLIHVCAAVADDAVDFSPISSCHDKRKPLFKAFRPNGRKTNMLESKTNTLLLYPTNERMTVTAALSQQEHFYAALRIRPRQSVFLPKFILWPLSLSSVLSPFFAFLFIFRSLVRSIFYFTLFIRVTDDIRFYYHFFLLFFFFFFGRLSIPSQLYHHPQKPISHPLEVLWNDINQWIFKRNQLQLNSGLRSLEHSPMIRMLSTWWFCLSMLISFNSTCVPGREERNAKKWEKIRKLRPERKRRAFYLRHIFDFEIEMREWAREVSHVRCIPWKLACNMPLVKIHTIKGMEQ